MSIIHVFVMSLLRVEDRESVVGCLRVATTHTISWEGQGTLGRTAPLHPPLPFPPPRCRCRRRPHCRHTLQRARGHDGPCYCMQKLTGTVWAMPVGLAVWAEKNGAGTLRWWSAEDTGGRSAPSGSFSRSHTSPGQQPGRGLCDCALPRPSQRPAPVKAVSSRNVTADLSRRRPQDISACAWGLLPGPSHSGRQLNWV